MAMLRVTVAPVVGSGPVSMKTNTSLYVLYTYSLYSSEPKQYWNDTLFERHTKSKSIVAHDVASLVMPRVCICGSV